LCCGSMIEYTTCNECGAMIYPLDFCYFCEGEVLCTDCGSDGNVDVYYKVLGEDVIYHRQSSFINLDDAREDFYIDCEEEYD